MSNPWNFLPKRSPYILKGDRGAITAFNKRQPQNSPFIVEEHLLPDPYLGNPKAGVVLLNLNPGYDGSEDNLHKVLVFRKLCLRNLLHRNTHSSQFYYFDQRLRRTAGYIWWSRKLSALVELFGEDTLGANLFVLEWFPYHSEKFRAPQHLSEAQLYSAQLLREAMNRKADIVVMRGKARWVKLVPELRKYSRLHYLRSPQSGSLSRKNLGQKSFRRIVRRLEEKRKR
jgi:hypothetical protein